MLGAAYGIVQVAGIGTDPQDRMAASGAGEQAALGELVYRDHCASCHGSNLEGQPDWQTRKPDGRLPAPPHDETGHTWHHADEVLFRITKEGVSAIVPGYKSDMPAFGSVLTDQQIWAVLAYIKSRWPRPIQDIHADIDRRLRDAHPTLFDQPHRLKLELPRELPSLHHPPPVPSKHPTRCL